MLFETAERNSKLRFANRNYYFITQLTNNYSQQKIRVLECYPLHTLTNLRVQNQLFLPKLILLKSFIFTKSFCVTFATSAACNGTLLIKLNENSSQVTPVVIDIDIRDNQSAFAISFHLPFYT